MNTRALRVVQVVSSLLVGGAERVAVTLSKELVRRGVNVSLVVLREYGIESLRPALADSRVSVIDLDAKRFYSPTALWRLVKHIRQHGAHLVHTHLTYADVMGRVAARLARVPMVSTLHNEYDSYAGHRVDHLLLERVTARHMTDRIVNVSSMARDVFVSAWSLAENKVVTVPNGIELSPWLAVPEKRPPCNGEYTVLTVGRLTNQKAQDVLVRAAVPVLGRLPNTRFVVVGRGELEDQLKNLALQLGVAHAFDFVGHRDDVVNLMARADVFALPSAREGMPLALIEAMAAARPIVATDVGGNRELLGEPPTGLLVRSGEPKSLGAALTRLLTDRGLASQLARNARKRAVAQFGLDKMVDRHLELYTELLSQRGTGARFDDARARR